MTRDEYTREGRRILAESTRIGREIESIFADVAEWNRMHPQEQPLNIDPDGSLRRARMQAARVKVAVTKKLAADNAEGRRDG